MQIELKDVATLIGPGTGQNIIWSIFLYVIFFFSIVTLFLIPDKNMIPTLLIATVLLCAVIAKISLAQTRNSILPPKHFGTYVINVAMFVLPIIAVGMTRAKKNRMAAPAILTAITGGIYFFMFWLIVQSH